MWKYKRAYWSLFEQFLNPLGERSHRSVLGITRQPPALRPEIVDSIAATIGDGQLESGSRRTDYCLTCRTTRDSRHLRSAGWYKNWAAARHRPTST